MLKRSPPPIPAAAVIQPVRKADRDMATQVHLLRDAIARHSVELDLLLAGTATCSTDQVEMRPDQVRLYDTEVLAARLEWAKDAAQRSLEAELTKTTALGPVRQLATCPPSQALDRLEEQFPHFAQVISLVRQRAALAAVTPMRVFSMPPILLAGSPGLGKTAFSEALSATLGVPVARVDMASASAAFVLAGSHSSWANSRAGAVWALLQSPMASGVMLVDELDKATDGNHPPAGPLYRLLEPASARQFADEYVEVAIDASRLMWIATCNDPDKLEPALRSRFVEFTVPAPSGSQMSAIAQSVYMARRAQATWGAAFAEQLDDEVTALFSACTPRQLARLIESAAAYAASACRTSIQRQDVEAAFGAVDHRAAHRHRIGFI
jgi:ATP-dependent Lon protease